MKAIHFNISRENSKVNELYLIKTGKELTFINTKFDNHPKYYLFEFDNSYKIKNVTVTVDAYVCSLFEELLEDSTLYKYTFMTMMFSYFGKQHHFLNINVNIVDPKIQVLDRRGNKISEQLGLERREVDHAMAWFSTLGGAFSALGDSLEHCAIMAGKISQQQFKLALRLNDPLLLARCRLYLALSLIQQRYFRQAKQLIKSQYEFATSGVICDQKLISMCHGIWAKLKYDKNKYKSQQKRLTCK